MALIFAGSTDVLAPAHTSRFLVPFLKFFFPSFDADSYGRIQLFIRKCGHFTEYAILAVLIWRAVRPMDRRGWAWPDARFAVMICLAYAATDEFHQTFVPSRVGSVVDVAIDTTGAVGGILLLFFLGRWRKKW